MQIKKLKSKAYKNVHKREKTVARAYGGSLCGAAVRNRLKFSLFRNLINLFLTFPLILKNSSCVLGGGTENREEDDSRDQSSCCEQLIFCYLVYVASVVEINFTLVMK